MKSSFKLLILFGFFISIEGFAESIYCPEKVICDKPYGCKFFPENSNFKPGTSTSLTGTYYFFRANYRVKQSYMDVCVYAHEKNYDTHLTLYSSVPLIYDATNPVLWTEMYKDSLYSCWSHYTQVEGCPFKRA